MSLTIGLDADDTLWHNETFFADTQARFATLLQPLVDLGHDELIAVLDQRERNNLPHFGYGVKSFTLSMVETAVDLAGDQLQPGHITAIIDFGREMLAHPVVLLDGVLETVEALAAHYRLVLVTKGELFHQESKFAASGLAPLFSGVEIVSEKDVETYRRILDRHAMDTSEFVMVGNSVRSDVLPVLELGARAVHIPFEVTWAHEHVEGADGFPVLDSIRELPDWLNSLH
jgi:putative hydrolase of the HAD superfamily